MPTPKNINRRWAVSSKKHVLGIPLFPRADIDADINRAYSFVRNYVKSKGFNDRLKRHFNKRNDIISYENIYKNREPTYTIDGNTTKKQKHNKYFISRDNKYISYYDRDQNHINYSNKQNEQIKQDEIKGEYNLGMPTAEYITSHELGHAVDRNIPIYLKGGGFEEYSTSYPQFTKYYNSNNVKGEHDKLPSEGYADLMSLRNELYRMGIFNSIKQNDNYKFNQKHLNTFKSINPKFRLFNNYTDDEIIDMMNNVAENKRNNQNQTTYMAKYGGQTNRRRKCWIGAVIGAATQLGSSLFNGIMQNNARKKQELNNRIAESYRVNAFNDVLNNNSVEDEYRDKVVFRYGGNRNKANYGCFAGRRVRR